MYDLLNKRVKGHTNQTSDATTFWRTATVVWNRSDILNNGYFQSSSSDSANSGFTTSARSLDTDFNFFHTKKHSFLGSIAGDELGSISSTFTRVDHDKTLPWRSVKVTLVLLKVARIYAIPLGILRPLLARLPVWAGAAASVASAAVLTSSAMIYYLFRDS